jgi:aminoglycoside phosphotransferase family enzyme
MNAESPASRGLPEAMLRPGAYAHPVDHLQLHETHISWVILAGPYAYKVKKPVNLGFLDFSTVERRATDCADEVRLNRRLCPDVYLGVCWLVERDGDLFVSGTGRQIEPIVQMRRLPAEGMLPHLIEHGRADADLVRRIGRHLARFHASAETGPGVNQYGSPQTVRANWDENFGQTEGLPEEILPGEARGAIVAYVERFLETQLALLERRVATGRIRDGHGDLHASSICVEGASLHLFDCIEFNTRFRCSDVAAEVAFLAMDLDHFGRPDLAAAFVDAYIADSGDTELRSLLDFYRCYRAYVRGKVAGLRLAEGDVTVREHDDLTAEARSYFDLALTYAHQPKS